MKLRTKALVGITVAAMVVTSAYVVGWLSGDAGHDLRLLPEVQAAGGKVKSPTSAAPERYAYYPGTEELRPDEMRVTACGTGMPAARLGQAATCWLVELGNGDKFLFDVGSGTMENLAKLRPVYRWVL